MILGVGVDIAAVARFRAIDPAHVLSPGEMDVYAAFGLPERKAEFLAGRFAVKEAIIKASPTGLSIRSVTAIDVGNDVNGRPFLASGQFPGARVWLSISHEGDYAVGLCVIESE